MTQQVDTPRLELEIFQGEPLILGAMWRREVRAEWLLLLPLLSIVLLVVSAAVTGNLSQTGLGTLLCHDFAAYLNSGKWSCARSAETTQIGLLRDLPTLTVVLILTVTPYLMYHQWSGISRFLENMREREILAFPAGPEIVAAKVAKTNTYFAAVARTNPLVMLSAVAIVLLVCLAHQRDGVYAVLFTPKSSAAGAGSHDNWWASFTASPINWFLYVLIGSTGVYIILLQNLYGGRTVLLLWQIRKDVRYLADPDNLDGNYGWSEARQILRATWVAIMLHGIALALVALSLSDRRALYLLPALAQWIATTPLYVGLPLLLVRRSIKRFKQEEQKRLNELYGRASNFVERGGIADRIDRVRKVRVLPFVGAVGKTISLVGFVSSVVAVVKIGLLIY